MIAVVSASSLALGHDSGVDGTPKPYCEDLFPGDTETHDYAAGAGVLLTGAWDGAFPPCPYDPTTDGHYEFAFGGAWLLACEGPCSTFDGGYGAGALTCWGTYADHAPYTHVTVFDEVVNPVGFVVGADHWDNVPPSPDAFDCGDFESDVLQDCVGSCAAAHLPGKDGSYQVFVSGTSGHVVTQQGNPPPTANLCRVELWLEELRVTLDTEPGAADEWQVTTISSTVNAAPVVWGPQADGGGAPPFAIPINRLVGVKHFPKDAIPPLTLVAEVDEVDTLANEGHRVGEGAPRAGLPPAPGPRCAPALRLRRHGRARPLGWRPQRRRLGARHVLGWRGPLSLEARGPRAGDPAGAGAARGGAWRSAAPIGSAGGVRVRA